MQGHSCTDSFSNNVFAVCLFKITFEFLSSGTCTWLRVTTSYPAPSAIPQRE